MQGMIRLVFGSVHYCKDVQNPVWFIFPYGFNHAALCAMGCFFS